MWAMWPALSMITARAEGIRSAVSSARAAGKVMSCRPWSRSRAGRALPAAGLRRQAGAGRMPAFQGRIHSAEKRTAARRSR